MATSRIRLAALAIASVTIWSPRAEAGDTSEGRAIYMGNAPTGFAHVGQETKVAASRFGCGSCHGGDGLGGSEGGYAAPAITRARLESAAAKRSAYDLETFARLISTGIDPSGRVLAPVMPRYELAPEAVASLYEFLGKVEASDRAGVADSEVTLGVLYDQGERDAGDLIVRSLKAALAKLGNPRVFGRAISIKPYASDDPRVADEVLAAVMPVADISSTAGWRLPVIAPVRGTRGDEDATLVRGVQASARDQWKALAAEAPGDAPIVYPPQMPKTEAAAQVRLFGLGTEQRLQSLEGWAQARKPGPILLLGGLAAAAPPDQSISGTVVLSTLDGSAAGLKAWLAAGASVVLADARPVDRENNEVPDLDRVAEATLRVLLEVVARTGRDLTRTRLMSSFDDATITLPNWPRMNYGDFRLNGTDEVSLLRLAATGANP